MKPIASQLLVPAAILCMAAVVGIAITYSVVLFTGSTPASGHSEETLAALNTPTPPPASTNATTDAVLLYDSKDQQIYDTGFQRLATYYGLSLKQVDLSSQPLTDTLLQDEAGRYYHTIAIAGASLDTIVDDAGARLLKSLVESGSNVLVAGMPLQESPGLRALSDGEITGSTAPDDPGTDYHVSNIWPEVTREFSGADVVGDKKQVDRALTISSHTPNCQALVTSTDALNRIYPVFAICSEGTGHLFVSSATPDGALKASPLSSSYYAVNQPDLTIKAQRFAQIVPLMMFIRYSAGDAAWHQDHHYANLTLDDPSLTTDQFNYQSLLQHATDHDFHMTVAMPPKYYTSTDQSVVDLFVEHPDKLSVIQHGNNHDGYEFYNYASDPKESANPNKPNTRAEQEANIVEGLTRMEAFTRSTHIPFAHAMIFPFNISPADTLTMLKEYNFQGTINSQDYPLDAPRVTTWDSYMYQSELAYNDFSVIGRTGPRGDPYPFSLFIGQPILLYVHKDFFGNNLGAFDPIADHINGLQGKVEWQSLDYILKRLYLERTTHDGTVDVMFYGNDLVVSNESARNNTYHLQREETQNVPIAKVALDGQPAKYQVSNGMLTVDAQIPASGSRELTITYAPPGRDFAIAASDVTIDAAKHVATVTIHNKGSQAGPAPVGIFTGTPDSGTLLGLATAQRIEAGKSAVVTIPLNALPSGKLTVAVDPYNVIQETDESNNTVTVEAPASKP